MIDMKDKEVDKCGWAGPLLWVCTKDNYVVHYKKRIKALEKELNRKERALAETAALLVLRKKLNALWEENEAE